MYRVQPKVLAMAPNRRLVRALNALSQERKQRQRELAEVQGRRGQLSSAIARLNDCSEAAIKTAVLDDDGNFDANLYLVARTAESRLALEIDLLEKRLENFDKNVTAQVEDRLRTSAIRERAVETLISRQKTAAKKEQSHRDLREMDEYGRNRWLSCKLRKPK
ncbi:MAG: hypothetical protein KTR25_07485 [Myxococcales bacterium]|nr:hypothetical protein [Myxococcales bacterium]